MLLKQSTAVVIPFGPFVDKTDGVTLETGLVSAIDDAATGIMLSKNGGTLAVRHAAVTASEYDAHGCYKVTLDTTDTGTLGNLRVIYTDPATCLPVWQDFRVVPANVYDSLVGGSDLLQVDSTQQGGTALTARDIGASVLLSSGAGAGQLDFTNGVVKANLVQILASAIAGTAAQISGAFTKFFDKAAPTGTINSLPDAVSGAAGGLPTTNGTKMSQTVDLTAGQTIAANLTQILGTALTETAGYLAAGFKKFFNIAAPASTMDALTLVATTTNLTNAPTNGDLTATMKTSVTTAATASTPALSAAGVDAIWDEALSGHAGGGSAGAALAGAGAAGDPWTTPIPGAYGVGTAGKIIGDNLNATVGSRSSHSAADVWAVGTRTLTSFGTLVADIATAVWGAAARTLTAFGFNVTAATVSDKTGYALATPPPTAADVKNALEADGSKLDHLWEMTEDDGGVRRLTANALEQAPSGGSALTTAEIADKILGRNIGGGSDGGRTVTGALRTVRNKIDTVTVPGKAIIYREDDVTEDHRRDLTTDATALPIVTCDPTT